MTLAQKLAWVALGVVLSCAAAFFTITAYALPATVAVHFDAGGKATSFLSSSNYCALVVVTGIALPLGVAIGMTLLYSRATQLRLPHREYWMAPARIAASRAFLKAHGIWFGVLLTVLMSFMHWLILSANALQPPQLATQTLLVGSVWILVCTSGWIVALMVRFRRPL